jgi:hypothetical protein
VNQVKDLREICVPSPLRGILSCGLNRDVVPRTTTANNGTWSSGELQEGESWEMVVGVSGVRDYFCEFHPDMKGVLEVRLVLTRILFAR